MLRLVMCRFHAETAVSFAGIIAGAIASAMERGPFSLHVEPSVMLALLHEAYVRCTHLGSLSEIRSDGG